MKYGQLLVCVKTADGRLVCIVRGLEAMVSPLGIPITNEFDCPLLCLSRIIFTTTSSDIVKAVSIVHECTETCQFIDTDCSQQVEREDITMTRLEYKHDFTGNFMFCLNVYCMRT